MHSKHAYFKAFGMDKVLDKFLAVLKDPRLKIQFNSDQTFQYFPWSKLLNLDLSIDIGGTQLCHELTHAYNHLIHGGMNRQDDEVLAHAMQTVFSYNFFGKEITKFIDLLNTEGVTDEQIQTAWNELWKFDGRKSSKNYVYPGDDGSISERFWSIKGDWRYFLNPFNPEDMSSRFMDSDDYIRLITIYGLTLYPSALLDSLEDKIPDSLELDPYLPMPHFPRQLPKTIRP